MLLAFTPSLLPTGCRPVPIRPGLLKRKYYGIQDRRNVTSRSTWRSLVETSRFVSETSGKQLRHDELAEPASAQAQKLVASKQLDPSDARILSTWTPTRASLFARVLANRSRHVTFVLDGVHGAHNLAAIVRTSDAWGVQDLHFISPRIESGEDSDESKLPLRERQVPLLDRFDNEYSVKSVSKNAHKWLTIQEHATPADAIQRLKKANYKLYASSLSSTAKSIESIDVSQKCAFIFGNETHGVTDEMQQAADGFFTIPMVGFVESMNVSVAVATTASLTIPRARTILPPEVFYLATSECSQLAHAWLCERPRPKPPPARKISTRGDVTRLGTPVERRVMEKGVFANSHISQQYDSALQYWRSFFSLHGETGGLILSYFQRRKFGALGDRKWDVRCNSITYFIAGVQALTCAATIALYPTHSRNDRPALMRVFRAICEEIHAKYRPHFDTFGYPKAPPNVPEAERPVRAISFGLADTVLSAAKQYAEDALEISSSDAQNIIETVTIQDVCRCITQTLRLPEAVAHSFTSKVMSSLSRMSELQSLLSTRNRQDEPLRSLSPTMIQREVASTQPDDLKRIVFLHVLLRMSNTAFLTSEMHQAAWDNAADFRTSRVRSLHFNFLEALSCDALSEMELLRADEHISLLRVALEWYRLIWMLRQPLSIIDPASPEST